MRPLFLLVVLIVAGLAAACVPTVSNPKEYLARPISAEAGAEYFQRTGGGDPYATGMAYPVFLALMEAYPNELGHDWKEFTEKFGMVEDPAAKGDPSMPPLGFHLTTDPNSDVPWLVANCQMCHVNRIHLETGDLVVTGLGNPYARPHAYANALVRIGSDPELTTQRLEGLALRRARAWKVPWSERIAPYIVAATVEGLKTFAKKRAPWVKRFDEALPGRTGTIESFAIALGEARGAPIPMADVTGWSKIPDVRSFPFRDTFSFDGSGYGSPQALVLEADFVFGTRPEWYLTHLHIATSMYLYLKGFTRHLPYPKPIDGALAKHGKEAFEARCAGCHGFYVDRGDEMGVSYKERVIPKEVVGTDPVRVDAVTKEFVDAGNAYPLTRGLTAVRNTGGYVPPVLLDVWARGFYGHVGQWPSLEALATAPADRPHKYIVDTRGLYDLDRVGERYEIVTTASPRALAPNEYLYDGDKPGYSVDGHPFLADLPPEDRRAVIEYLKTL